MYINLGSKLCHLCFFHFNIADKLKICIYIKLTPILNVSADHIIPPRNRHSFHIIAFTFCICLLISSTLFLPTYIYIKSTSQKVVLQSYTVNLISFNTNDSHGPLNVTFSYTFYNPNSEFNLDVHDGTMVLYSNLLRKHLATIFSDLSL